MYHLTITADNGRYWKTPETNGGDMVALMKEIMVTGLFECEDDTMNWVNPAHIVSIELIEE